MNREGDIVMVNNIPDITHHCRVLMKITVDREEEGYARCRFRGEIIDIRNKGELDQFHEEPLRTGESWNFYECDSHDPYNLLMGEVSETGDTNA